MNNRNRLLLLLATLLSGCAGAYLEYTPIKNGDGDTGYFIKTVYGGMDGTKNQASEVLDREANRLCGDEYKLADKEEHKRLTAWGAENGQIDCIWEIYCG